MQTPQVSNPVNVLSSPVPAAKQSDADSSAAPFGQVLSREVANRRSASETPSSRDTGNATATRNASKNDAKPTAAKPAGEAGEEAEISEDISAAAAALPEDLLSLVANLTQMNAPAAEVNDAAATAAQNTQAEVDPALATAMGNTETVGAITADPLTAQLANSAQLTDSTDIRTRPRQESTASALMSDIGSARQQREAATADQTELPGTSALDLAAKGKELLQGSAGATANVRDFAAEVKESLSNVTNGLQQVQQAALHTAQPTPAQGTEKLTPRVGTPAWDQALGQKVVWMVAGEHQSASLTLNPPDLGPLQVVLNVSNSQANATFIAAQPEVRQALEAALPRLREMLGEAGISLGQTSVNSGAPNQQGSSDQHAGHPTHRLEQAGIRGDASVHVSRVQPASSGQGLVDTFV